MPLKLAKKQFIQTTGRHKEAVARVRLTSGSGVIQINNTVVEKLAKEILAPLKLSGYQSRVDLSIQINGGGTTGQTKAMRLGLARALILADDEVKTSLKKNGYLKRDPRVKERKKYGLKSARRAPQWSKR